MRQHASRPADGFDSLPWLFTLSLVCIIGAGIALRFWSFGVYPPGLYHDEAAYGLDAAGILEGNHALYFPANNGREPLYIYIMSLTIALLGRTVVGVRVASLICGLFTLPATYLMGAAMFGKRVGLLSAAILSITLWHIHLSRVGFRAISLVLLIALAAALAAHGLREQRWPAVVVAGIAYGLSFYTYLAARFTPLAVVLIVLYGLIWHPGWVARRRYLIAALLGVAFVVSVPLVSLAVRQPDLVLARGGQVAIWSPAVHQGEPLRLLVRNIMATLGMLTWQGDWIWRHNVPYRPVFDPLLGAAFILGVALTIRGWRQRPALAVSAIWALTMLLPTLLAEDAPHFLRGVGILPVVVVFPAFAIDRLIVCLNRCAIDRRAVACRTIALATSLLPALMLSISTTLTARDYFGCRTLPWIRLNDFTYSGCYQTDPSLGWFFQAEATELAEDIASSPGQVYLNARYWDGFASVRFLAGGNNRLVLYEEGASLSPVTPPVTLIAWPYNGLESALEIIPANTQVAVYPGPLTRGDTPIDPYRLYTRWIITDIADLPAAPVVRFDNGLDLQDMSAEQIDGTIVVTLRWRIEDVVAWQPATLFIHVVDQAGDILSQVDEPPGGVDFPPLSWPEGSVIIQQSRHIRYWPVNTKVSVVLGLYNSPTGERIQGHRYPERLPLESIQLPVKESDVR